ncbi:MAG: hypothetical protein HOH43_07390 [Candidatus Latescibacteria bacterium]|nr:hypothetical protein [Candidatus Latescibacterota bacterium]
MTIEEIELHEIHPSLQSFNRDALKLQQGDSYDTRTIIILRSDSGQEGIGETLGASDTGLREELDPLRGTNPARWLAHPSLRIGVATAIYDLVAKNLEVPVSALFGPKLRSWVPVGYWTVSQSPEKMAGEVEHAVQLGYTWLKYHTDQFHNIIDQTRAMQEVAPPGFKVHYDLNFDGTVEHVAGLANRLSEYPVAGLIEDPLHPHDLTGYRLLRSKSQLPIVFHHLPLGGREAVMDLADGYMLGHAPVGQVIARAGLFEAMNTPFMIQNVGGAITRAMVAHMAAAFEMATMHHVTDTFAWKEDVTVPDWKVCAGTIQVPDTPGLGVSVDYSALDKLKSSAPSPMPQALVRVQAEGIPRAYARPPRARRDALGLDPRGVPGIGDGYDNRVDMDYWYDDGSREFSELWTRTGVAPVICGSGV